MLRYGIPAYRLPKNVLDSEIKDIENMGVEIRTNMRIESIDDLLTQGYDAVLIAVGAHKGVKLRIPGAQGEGALVNLEFLRAVISGEKVGFG
jgi:NADPH-dependent glutamate synthase beta subunit-like oxidoreductase